MRLFLRELIAVWAVSLLILGAASTATFVLSADAAYAKHGDKGKGGKGKGGKGDRDKGDRDKGDREKGERHGKKGKGHKSDKHYRDGKYAKHGYKGKKHGWHHGKKGKYGYRSWYDDGRHKKNSKRGKHGWDGKYAKRNPDRDRRRLDGDWYTRDERNKDWRNTRKARRYGSDDGYKKRRSVKKLDKSMRPKKRRDPLAVAITDRNGSDKLRNLNAAKASPVAFRNASANSNVGKIAAYQESAGEYYESREALKRRKARLERLEENYDGRTSDEVQDDIDALDPDSDTFEQDLAALEKELEGAETYEERRSTLRKRVVSAKKEVVADREQAEDDFFDASKGREVTPKVLSQLHRILGLPAPGKTPKQDDGSSDVASVE